MSVQPLEVRMARLEGAYEQIADRLNGIEQMLGLRFGQVDSRFAQIDSRFAQIDTRFAQIDSRFVQIDTRFAQIDSRFVQVDTRFEGLERKIDANFRTIITWMLGQTAVILGAVAAFALHR